MDEPEIQPEAGTGAEEVATETVEETEVTDTPADDSADGETEETEAEAQGHETQAETNVPYSRFKSVNERRKAAEAKAIELEARLAALSPKEEARPVSPKARLKGLTPAPADMTPLEQMEHYGLQALEAHPEILDRWFASKFGMAPEAAAATLSYTSNTTRESILANFEKACGERGIDPKNPAVQDAVGRMMDSKKYKSFGDALDVFVKPKTVSKAPPKPVTRGAESGGVEVPGLSRVRILPKTAKEASILAAQGKSIEHVSVSDILKASMGSN